MRHSAVSAISRGWRLITSTTGARSMRRSCESRAKHRRLEDARTDVETNDDEREAEDERHPPAPDQELISGEGAAPEHGEVRQEQPDRDTELRPRRDESTMLVRLRPFHRQQHRAAPLAADADALHEPQHGEEDGSPHADALVGGDERDEKCGDAHQQQRRNQRRLAAEAIAVVPENRRADRPGHEPDGIHAERLERADEVDQRPGKIVAGRRGR